ncbi:MAG: hypothetical protein Q9222_003923 [Ikaeria aurantiellina]
MNVPEYHAGDSNGTVYCDRDCQKEHWPDHKEQCRALGQRKKLLRSAEILKAALLTYREVMYDIDLTKIEFKDGVLCLHQNQRHNTTQTKRGLFPAHLTTNVDRKEAALVNNQCTTAMALSGRLTWMLLQGVASTIEVLDLHIGKPLVPTKLIPGPDSAGWPHTVLKVRSSAREVSIIDPAGRQYGFEEVLVSLEKYIADKSCKTPKEPTAYDWTETKDVDFFSTLPFMNKTKAQRDDNKLERRIRLHFAAFVDTRVTKDILDGPLAEFKGKLDNFVQELKSHMLNFNGRNPSSIVQNQRVTKVDRSSGELHTTEPRIPNSAAGNGTNCGVKIVGNLETPGTKKTPHPNNPGRLHTKSSKTSKHLINHEDLSAHHEKPLHPCYHLLSHHQDYHNLNTPAVPPSTPPTKNFKELADFASDPPDPDVSIPQPSLSQPYKHLTFRNPALTTPLANLQLPSDPLYVANLFRAGHPTLSINRTKTPSFDVLGFYAGCLAYPTDPNVQGYQVVKCQFSVQWDSWARGAIRVDVCARG